MKKVALYFHFIHEKVQIINLPKVIKLVNSGMIPERNGKKEWLEEVLNASLLTLLRTI